jgi:hypothetical protein
MKTSDVSFLAKMSRSLGSPLGMKTARFELRRKVRNGGPEVSSLQRISEDCEIVARIDRARKVARSKFENLKSPGFQS